MTRPFRVLFVCTANIARSPYAERRARELLAASPVEVASAGVRARNGHAMDTEMARQVERRGGTAEGHWSHRVTSEAIARADLVLAFEFGQHMQLVDAWPQHAHKIAGFNQFVTAVRGLPRRWSTEDAVRQVLALAPPDSLSLDVRDPHGRGARPAAACADEIDAGLEVLVPFLRVARPGVGPEAGDVAAPEVEEADVVRAVEPEVEPEVAETPADLPPPPPLPVAPRPTGAVAPRAVTPSRAAHPPRRPGTSLLAGGVIALLGGVLALVAAAPASAAWWGGLIAALAGAASSLVGGLWWRRRLTGDR